MSDDEAPRQISIAQIPLELDGYLMPAHENRQPVLLSFTGSEDVFLPVFSTEEKLIAGMKAAGQDYARVQRIDDGYEFLTSLGENELPVTLRVIVDPYRHENGHIRFLEVLGKN